MEYGPSRWNPDGKKRIVHIDTQPAEVDASYRPEVELIGDIDGSLRRLLEVVAAEGDLGAHAPRSATPRARSSSTPTCAHGCSRTCGRSRTTTRRG